MAQQKNIQSYLLGAKLRLGLSCAGELKVLDKDEEFAEVADSHRQGGRVSSG